MYIVYIDSPPNRPRKHWVGVKRKCQFRFRMSLRMLHDVREYTAAHHAMFHQLT